MDPDEQEGPQQVGHRLGAMPDGDAIQLAVECGRLAPWTVLNIGTGQIESFDELSAALARLDPTVRIEVDHSEGIPRAPLDIDQAVNVLNFKFHYDLAKGLVDHRREYER